MREEIRMISEALDRNERCAFVGASGCGKTSTMREVLAARHGDPQRVIVFDPFGDFRLPEVRTVRQAAAILQGPWGRLRVDRPALFSDLCEIALVCGNCLIVCDEAQRILPSTGRDTEASASLMSVITDGRHENCPLMWASQSPGKCSYSLTDNSTGARVVGSLTAPSSLSRVEDWGLDKRKVAALPLHQLFLSIPGRFPMPFVSRR
jgi:hypothetical protein